MELPAHIEKKSETWYYNTSTKRYIHKDKIEAFCERYWKNRTGVKKPAVNYKRNVKASFRRWENEL